MKININEKACKWKYLQEDRDPRELPSIHIIIKHLISTYQFLRFLESKTRNSCLIFLLQETTIKMQMHA